MARVFLLLISILAAEVYGFAPILSPSRAVVSPAPSRVVLRMVESEKTEEAEEKVPVVSVDGTYFDDEVSRSPCSALRPGLTVFAWKQQATKTLLLTLHSTVIVDEQIRLSPLPR